MSATNTKKTDLRHRDSHIPCEGEVVEFCQHDDSDHDGPCYGDDEDQCHHQDCEVTFSLNDEDDYVYIKGKEPIYICNSCYEKNKEEYDEIDAEYATDDEETDDSESEDE